MVCALIKIDQKTYQDCIYRYVKLEDRKRALVSRLLQYALVHQVLGIPYNEIVIRSTVEGKPYVVSSHFTDLKFSMDILYLSFHLRNVEATI